MPRISIDHAVAAGQWANRTDDQRLRAYTADVTARAYAADGQRDACVAALDTAHALLTKADYQAPSYSTYNEAGYISIRGGCHLTLGETDHAISYAQQSLTVMDRIFTRDVAMTFVYLGQAHVQCNEVEEAARLLGDAGDIAATHSSARLIGRLEQAHADLNPGNTPPPSARSMTAWRLWGWREVAKEPRTHDCCPASEPTTDQDVAHERGNDRELVHPHLRSWNLSRSSS